jgi:hypothetical protein
MPSDLLFNWVMGILPLAAIAKKAICKSKGKKMRVRNEYKECGRNCREVNNEGT